MKNPEKTRLRREQKGLYGLITAPEGIGKTLSRLESPPSSLPIGDGRTMSAVERLDVYANMFFFRLRDSLKEDFPALSFYLGEMGFHNLVTAYLEECPPSHYSIRYAGQKLGGFLQTDPRYKKKGFLSELALYEWQLLEAFDAPDIAPLTEDHLRQFTPLMWEKWVPQVQPGSSLAQVSYDVIFWHTQLINKKKELPKKKRGFLRIWRQNYKSYARSVSKEEFELLQLIRRGSSFSKLGAKLAEKMNPEKASILLGQCVMNWVKDGYLSKLFKDF